MELYQLRTFVTVAEEGHLTRAAERLCLSQPAVSAHIKALEEELGVSLFTRTSRGMQATDAGQRLKGQAEKALSVVGDLVRQAGLLREEVSGEVRVGMNTDPEFLRLVDMVGAVKAEAPKLELHLLQSMSGLIVDAVRTGRMEAGFVFWLSFPPELKVRRLKGVSLRIVAPPDWSPRLKDASWEDLSALPWIWTPPHCAYHQLAEFEFSSRGCMPDKVFIADYERIMKALVEAGVGLSIMREDEAQAALSAGEVAVWEHGELRLDLSFITLKDREEDPRVRAVALAVERTWGLSGQGPISRP